MEGLASSNRLAVAYWLASVESMLVVGKQRWSMANPT